MGVFDAGRQAARKTRRFSRLRAYPPLAPLTDRRSYRRFSVVRSHSSTLEHWLTSCHGGRQGRSAVGRDQSPSGVIR